LLVRAFVSTSAGAWGNAAAIALFIVTAAALALQSKFKLLLCSHSR